MIVAERKPLSELEGFLEGYRKALILGCGTCVTVCMAGGEKEVGILSSMLRMSARKKAQEIEIVEATVERQCDREFLDPLKARVADADVVLSMACGVGVNFMNEVFEDVIVVPALNTRFYGTTLAEGVWAERCAGCGDCMLSLTAGICPIARCAKSLLNGPCGGSQEGKCEVNDEITCAWQLIYERMERLGRLKELETVIPAKDWSAGRDGGPGKVVREDVTV